MYTVSHCYTNCLTGVSLGNNSRDMVDYVFTCKASENQYSPINRYIDIFIIHY